MKRFIITIVLCLICIVFDVSNIYAGSEPPFGLELYKKTISGNLTIIQLDPADPVAGTVALVTGTCKKVPFVAGPLERPGVYFNTLVDETSFFDENGDPQLYPTGILSECHPEAYGGAITGFKTWNKVGDVIFAEVYLQILVPIGTK